jgi:prephenate dehydratase
MNQKEFSTQSNLKVAIQGVAGAFHDLAARQYFNNRDIDIVPCDTFKEAFDSVKFHDADMAIVAIENSLAGSLLPNYTLLKNSGLTIAGEKYLRIEQHLMAMPGQTLDDIHEIQSHPMAIIQCEEFLEPLRRKKVKIIDSVDTALSARYISENQLRGVAAIASDLAARMYNLNIIHQSIETNKRNFTRFLVLGPSDLVEQLREGMVEKPDKASISFTLPHETGSLSQVLSVLAYYKLNLTKIQSAPIVGREWEYIFYLDLTYDTQQMFTGALEAIRPLIDQLQILGEYHAGRW